MDPLPPGLFQASQQGGVKPPGPIVKTKTGPKAATIDSVDELLAVVALGAGATVTGADSPAYKAFVKFATGFKVIDPAAAGAAPTVGAVMFIMPQPLGLLPERFFQGKPGIPGTEIYFDPLYTIQRQVDKFDVRQQNAASVSQRIQFERLLEDFADDELRRLINKENLKATYLQFLNPQYVDQEVLSELRKRKAKRDIEEATNNRLEAIARQSAIIFFLAVGFPDTLFAANPPDP